MTNKKKITIIGATGFGGLGLIQILLDHPGFEITQLSARKDTGKNISEIFPSLEGVFSQTIIDFSDIDFENIDLAFFSTPDQTGMKLIDEFHKRAIPVIDFSGDFRFSNSEEYKVYAENKNLPFKHSREDLLEKSVYGLIEKNRDLIKNSAIIGNPGCFAISMILGLLPAASAGIIKEGTIFCDGKSGVSGAGKNPGEANFYPQRYENINSYREGSHQHLVEVENIIKKNSPNSHKILFVPQVIPMTRGILSTLYFNPTDNISNEQLSEIYNTYYRDEPFVEISGKSPGTADVRGTNKCRIRPIYDARTGEVVIISAIDNLMKGQSGNAVQIANILFGYEENTGLNSIVQYP